MKTKSSTRCHGLRTGWRRTVRRSSRQASDPSGSTTTRPLFSGRSSCSPSTASRSGRRQASSWLLTAGTSC
jgi:hypothetical protein